MKRIMLALCLLLSTPAFAEGPYDGAWTVPNGNFATFIQKGSEVLVLLLEQDLSGWVPMMGTLNGTQMTGVSVVGLNLRITVVFTSTSTANVTIDSCAPIQECAFTPGTKFTITKMF